MTGYNDIFRRVQGIVHWATAWSGVVYRNATIRYATAHDLLTGEGSQKAGGRWNPRGIAAVYGSLAPETAMAEALSTFRYYGWDISDAMPRIFVAVRVSLGHVLDLTEGAVRQRLGFSMQRILTDDWRKAQGTGIESPAQATGRAVFASGLEGLLVPSAADASGKNAVWFPPNLSSACKIVVCRADQLPG